MDSALRHESPLDPFLREFLVIVDSNESGFQPGPQSAKLASRMGTPQAFVDALFTSARTRGLLKPMYGRGTKIRWGVSPRGRDFIHEAAT